MESVYLMGSENVARAGHQMTAAAEGMERASCRIAEALDRHRIVMEDMLVRFEELTAAAFGSKSS